MFVRSIMISRQWSFKVESGEKDYLDTLLVGQKVYLGTLLVGQKQTKLFHFRTRRAREIRNVLRGGALQLYSTESNVFDLYLPSPFGFCKSSICNQALNFFISTLVE